MKKRFRVEFPEEAIVAAADASAISRALHGMTGTIWVQSPADFLRNTVAICG